jgi:hypothetical protein
MTLLLTRRALLDYARRPLNVMLLLAVPAVLVIALGGELASFSKLLSTTAKPTHLDVATAGWAAAAVAGLAGFFQVSGARRVDRRLATASRRGAGPVLAGRLAAAGMLAVAAAATALLTLAARYGITDPGRAIPAVLMVAILYIAIGVLVGALVRTEMNGALLVSTIWMLDVFVGSGLGGGSSLIERFFPIHFPTMVLTNQAAQHGGPLTDLAWSLIWTIGLAGLAVIRLLVTTRPARGAMRVRAADASPATQPVPGRASGTSSTTPATADPASAPAATPAAGCHLEPSRPHAWRPRCGQRCATNRRNRVLWALLLIVPVTFVALAAAQTPTTLLPVSLLDGAHHSIALISLRQIHAGEMASIASALLAGVAGLFVVTGSADGDRRLVLAGFRPRQVLAGHLAVIGGAAVLTAAVSLAVSVAFFSPRLWPEYLGADLLIALTYAMIGVLLGPLVGRLGGLYLLLLLSMVDVGYGQSVMFHPLPPGWGAFLPTRGAGRLLLDGSFTHRLRAVPQPTARTGLARRAERGRRPHLPASNRPPSADPACRSGRSADRRRLVEPTAPRACGR